MAEKIGDAFVEIGARTSRFTRAMAGVRQGLKNIGRRFMNFSRRVMVGGFVAMTAAAIASTKALVNFEAAMRNVNVIARQNEVQFAATSQEVLELSREMGKPATELAAALYDINSAGRVGSEGLEVLRVAAVAGRAGMSDTATAAKIISGVLNAYGKATSEAADISDILFKTVEKGVITFPELAQSLGTITATAAAAKVPFDQVAAAMATMTKGGIQAREAGTALNRMMFQMIDPPQALAAALKKAGIQSGASLLETRGLAGAMAFLAEETQGTAEGTTDLDFAIRAAKAVMSLTRKEGADYAADLAIIADESERAGSTQAAFKEQTKGLGVQLDKAKAAITSIAIAIGDELAPMVARGAQKVIKFGEKFEQMRIDGTLARWTATLQVFFVNLSANFKKAGIIAKGFFVGLWDFGKWAFTNLWDFTVAYYKTWWQVVKNLGSKLKGWWISIVDFFAGEPWKAPDNTALLDGVKEIWEAAGAPFDAFEKMSADLERVSAETATAEARIAKQLADKLSKLREVETAREIMDQKAVGKVVEQQEKKKRAEKQKTFQLIGLIELWTKAAKAFGKAKDEGLGVMGKGAKEALQKGLGVSAPIKSTPGMVDKMIGFNKEATSLLQKQFDEEKSQGKSLSELVDLEKKRAVFI